MAKSKTKTIFSCQNCGAQRPRWEGRCSDCGSWNSFVEESIDRNLESKSASSTAWIRNDSKQAAVDLGQEVVLQKKDRRKTGLSELDRVLGGGLTTGSFVLLGGSPGVGKSTLLMQMAGGLAASPMNLLYVTGEESVEQTALRAHRLGVRDSRIKVLSESNIDEIFKWIESTSAEAVIIDSIQTIFTTDIPASAGTVSQVRECAARLLSLAKTKGISVFLIGHITKDGSIAGPKVLEHMVDTVLSFEGESGHPYRILRALKNRFGAALELGVFRMESEGLTEVSNPSEFFLEQRQGTALGSAVYCSMEGSRPILCEIQALSLDSHFPQPRRTSVGIDLNRIHMVAAVLERHGGMNLSQSELYINVVGGLRLEDPAADLALAAAIASTHRNRSLPSTALFLGEIGLTGEVRAVQNADLRLREAIKLGFKTAFVPEGNRRFLKNLDIELIWIKTISNLDQWVQAN